MRISDWSSDVCSSDLNRQRGDFARPGVQVLQARLVDRRQMKAAAGSRLDQALAGEHMQRIPHRRHAACQQLCQHRRVEAISRPKLMRHDPLLDRVIDAFGGMARVHCTRCRSEEHTSELQSLMRISYAVFCLKNKNKTTK